jgi:hypothetical protein
MNFTPASPAYAVRANVFESEAVWRLGPQTLERSEGPDPADLRRISYDAITAIRLSFAPSRFDSVRYRCDVKTKWGSGLAILSTHYVGIGNFEDRGASYTPFVRELIARVAAANPKATFRAGKNPFVYALEHAFLLVAFTFLVLVLFLVGGAGLSDLVWVKLGIIVSFLPLLAAYTWKNWPRRLDPKAIPAEVLPAGEAAPEAS